MLSRPFIVSTGCAVAIVAAFWAMRVGDGVRIERLDDETVRAAALQSVSHAASATPADAGGAARVAASPVAAPATGGERAPVSAEVKRILPRLEYAVADWREYQPEKLSVAPYPDLEVEFERVSVRFENGRTVWIGRNRMDGAFLVTVATQREWHAVAELSGADNFELHVSGQSARVALSEGPHRCGNELGLKQADTSDEEMLSADTSHQPHQVAAAVNTVDVLFFYDGLALALAGGNPESVDTAIAARIASANVLLENSGVANLRWQYLAAYRVPEYTATDRLEDDLDLITYADNPVGEFVAAKCELHGADQAVIFVGGARDYAGIAWVPGAIGSVAQHSAARWNTGYSIVAHEMAHNFGCRHDRQSAGIADRDTRFWYGHRFNLEGRDTGTIMSYAPSIVPYFSNPQVSYRGVATGIAAGEPKAADNARVLRESASAMASVRSPPVLPIITRDPQSLVVGRGRGFTLSVGATGGGLSFQWRKDGIDIPEGTGVAFSKAAASDADAGIYSVRVSNLAGQAVSGDAAVTVNEAAAAPGSGGGGGGGATGAGTTFLLIALLAWRARSQCCPFARKLSAAG